MPKTLFVNAGTWENFLGMESKSINFPNGYGVRVEKQGSKFLVNTLKNSVVSFDVFYDELPMMNAEEVEALLEEVCAL